MLERTISLRRTIGIATTAVLAFGTLGIQTMTATGADAAPEGVSPKAVTTSAAKEGAIAKQAIAALTNHKGAALTKKGVTGQGYKVKDVLVESDGGSHVRLDRTFKGIPVVGGDLVVHQGKNGKWEGVSQTLKSPLDLGIKPSITAAKAQKAAMAPAKATKTIKGQKLAKGKPQLVIDATGAKPRLALLVTVGGVQKDGTPSEMLTYVDAKTGKVFKRVQGIQTDHVEGTGNTLYNGTVKLNLNKSKKGRYQLRDMVNGDGMSGVTDRENKSDPLFCALFGSNCPKGILFIQDDTEFGDGTTNDRATVAADAHYGHQETFTYFKDNFNRNGLSDDGKGYGGRVHVNKDYANAFWNGEFMSYGDGDGVSYGPLVSLDVAGHEMSHAVTEFSANLEYSGESGGLNESTSDIFGSMVEFFSNTEEDPADYYIGEQFDLENGVGFRRMDDPAAADESVNCWSPDVGQLNVHYSSGVGNHFFYLLAEGSGAKTIGDLPHNSPTCDGSTVTGIGREDAQAIWYKALTAYMTTNTDYKGARAATLSAAKDLFGEDSNQYKTVGAAWNAVNVK